MFHWMVPECIQFYAKFASFQLKLYLFFFLLQCLTANTQFVACTLRCFTRACMLLVFWDVWAELYCHMHVKIVCYSMRGIFGLFCGFFTIITSTNLIWGFIWFVNGWTNSWSHASPSNSIVWILEADEKLDQLINKWVNIHDHCNNEYKIEQYLSWISLSQWW